jgi:glycosyltransferase involved in cell wall biosynthesis
MLSSGRERNGHLKSGDENATVNVLFLAHCTHEKGLFHAVEGVRLVNEQLAAEHICLRLRLTVAGAFRDQSERAEWDRIWAVGGSAGWLAYAGFIAGEEKAAAFRHADVFCFPTYYGSEGQPLNLIEAMAFGLPIVTTRWRSIPEFIPSGYPGLIEPHDPGQVARGLWGVLPESGSGFRDVFLRSFAVERHLAALATAVHSVASAPSALQTP